MKGTWEGSGTWKTTGSGPGPVAALVVVLVLFAAGSGALSAVASALVTALITVAVLIVAAVVATVLVLWRRQGNRGATWTPVTDAGRPAVAEAVKPQVTKGTQPPAIEQHYHVHHHYAAAPEAVPSPRAITEER